MLNQQSVEHAKKRFRPHKKKNIENYKHSSQVRATQQKLLSNIWGTDVLNSTK